MRTHAFRFGGENVDAVDIDVRIGRPRGRRLSGRPQDDAIASADDRRLGRALPHVPDVAVGTDPRLAHAPRLGGEPLDLLRREIEPVELPPPAVVVRDEEGPGIRIPVGGNLAG